MKRANSIANMVIGIMSMVKKAQPRTTPSDAKPPKSAVTIPVLAAAGKNIKNVVVSNPALSCQRILVFSHLSTALSCCEALAPWVLKVFRALSCNVGKLLTKKLGAINKIPNVMAEALAALLEFRGRTK